MANYPIHPAAKTRCAKFGAEIISLPDGGFRLVEIATGHLSEETYDKVAECGQELEAGTVKYLTPKAPTGNKSGVMTRSYHDAYSKNPDGPGCGDMVDRAMRDAITVKDEKGKPYADPALVKQIGIDNGLWRDQWEGLNIGMQRMNLANRIRGFLRQDETRVATINGSTGRFAVEARAPKEKKAAKAA